MLLRWTICATFIFLNFFKPNYSNENLIKLRLTCVFLPNIGNDHNSLVMFLSNGPKMDEHPKAYVVHLWQLPLSLDHHRFGLHSHMYTKDLLRAYIQ